MSNTSSKVVVHHLNASRSWRVLWLLEEMQDAGIGVDFEIVHYQREATRLAPASLAKVHPLGKAPVIEHNGEVLGESSAIVAYLLGVFDGDHALHPDPSSKQFATYQYWLAAAEGAVMLPVLSAFVYMPMSGVDEQHPGRQYMEAEVKKVMGYVESHLSANTYLCGDTFTAADVMLAYVLDPRIEGVDRSSSHGPAIKAYLKRLETRPAFARMLAHGI